MREYSIATFIDPTPAGHHPTSSQSVSQRAAVYRLASRRETRESRPIEDGYKLHHTQYTTLHYTALHCTTLHYTALHCTGSWCREHKRPEACEAHERITRATRRQPYEMVRAIQRQDWSSSDANYVASKRELWPQITWLELRRCTNKDGAPVEGSRGPPLGGELTRRHIYAWYAAAAAGGEGATRVTRVVKRQ